MFSSVFFRFIYFIQTGSLSDPRAHTDFSDLVRERQAPMVSASLVLESNSHCHNTFWFLVCESVDQTGTHDYRKKNYRRSSPSILSWIFYFVLCRNHPPLQLPLCYILQLSELIWSTCRNVLYNFQF